MIPLLRAPLRLMALVAYLHTQIIGPKYTSHIHDIYGPTLACANEIHDSCSLYIRTHVWSHLHIPFMVYIWLHSRMRHSGWWPLYPIHTHTCMVPNAYPIYIIYMVPLLRAQLRLVALVAFIYIYIYIWSHVYFPYINIWSHTHVRHWGWWPLYIYIWSRKYTPYTWPIYIYGPTLACTIEATGLCNLYERMYIWSHTYTPRISHIHIYVVPI